MPSWSCAAGAAVATAPLCAAVRWRSQNPTAATVRQRQHHGTHGQRLGRRLISVAGPAAIVASGRIVRCGSWWPPTSSALDPITLVRDLGRGSMIIAPAACSSVRSLASSGESGAASVSPASSSRAWTSARLSSPASLKRLPGSRAIARSTMSTSSAGVAGARLRSGTASRSRRRASTSCIGWFSKARWPERIS